MPRVHCDYTADGAPRRLRQLGEQGIFSRLRGRTLTTAEVDELWATFDTDSSGTLDKQEFTALMHQCASKPRPMPFPSDF